MYGLRGYGVSHLLSAPSQKYKSRRKSEKNAPICTGNSRAPPPQARDAQFRQPNTCSSQQGWCPFNPWAALMAFVTYGRGYRRSEGSHAPTPAAFHSFCSGIEPWCGLSALQTWAACINSFSLLKFPMFNIWYFGSFYNEPTFSLWTITKH